MPVTANRERGQLMRGLTKVLALAVIAALAVVLSGCACAREVLVDRPSRMDPSQQPEEQTSERTGGPAAGESVVALDTGNNLGIRAGGTAPSFTLDRPATLETVTTYHYIDGGGPSPGTLGLEAADGTTYGPWRAYGLDGQGGVANAFWRVEPGVSLPVGTYTVVDSDPATWSTNDTAGGVGFTTVTVVYE